MSPFAGWGVERAVSLVVKVSCPDCGTIHESASLGAELRCTRCGRDFRAKADGDGASHVLSVTPDELDNVPYSQRAIEVPVNSVSSVIVADPALLNDKLLRDVPVKENARWLGKVRLIKKLGQGGMGAVYRGYDESLALDVAVKILPMPSGQRDDQFAQRFHQEARMSAQIHHPNVVRTLHVDEQGDLVYLVMDFVQGQTAKNLVDAKGPLQFPLALQITHDAALGVKAAHDHNIIHRDIKPDNILVADDGRVLLSDLGLAKAVSTSGHKASRMPVTRMGLLLGTPEYMSPEQWEIGANITPLTDIWSIGATLWMLLTHQPPYDEKDLALLARKIKEAPLPDIRAIRPNVPDCIIDVLERCLAKQPQDRYVDCASLLAALKFALDEIAAGRATVTPRRPQLTSTAIYRPSALTPSWASPSSAFSPPRVIGGVGVTPLPVPSQPAPVQPAANAVSSAFKAPNRPNLAPPPASRPRSNAWLAIPALAIIAIGAWAIFGRAPQNVTPVQPVQQVAVVQPVSVELRCPTQVRPGQQAELYAAVSGPNPDDYAVTWLSGAKEFPGNPVQIPLTEDADFAVSVRSKSKNAELVRRSFKVSVDVEAHAADKDFYEIVPGSDLKISGVVKGGSGNGSLETRWIDAAKPDQTLSVGTDFELPKDGTYAQPGRYTFEFQARRKGQQNWSTDKIVVAVTKRVPPEYKNQLQAAIQTRDQAQKALTGAESLAMWKQALSEFEKAAEIFPDEEAKLQAAQCKQRLELEEKYAGLLDEAKRLKREAESIPESDGVRRLSAWSEALRPSAAAIVLFDRPEARSWATSVAAHVQEIKAKLEREEKERGEFQAAIAKARASVREAQKYLNPGVALPHWEAAIDGFESLKKQFPHRYDEFSLEMKESQENRDKAFLFESMGIVPVKPAERVPEVVPKDEAAPVKAGNEPAPKSNK